MKTAKLSLFAIAAVFIAACHTSKKGSTSTASTVPAATPVSAAPTATTASSYNLNFAKSSNGIYAPGNEELTAIQATYHDATLAQLKEGYFLYTEGACIKCHNAMNIYKHGEAQWKNIIDDMAQKANISDVQKDAVYKYVLAIKATQPK